MKKRIERLIAQFRKDRETIRSLHGKKKLQFIWDYYKIPIIVLGFAAVVAVLAVLVRSPKKDTAVYIVWVNAVSQDENTYFDELLHEADPAFYIADETYFDRYERKDAFTDLSELIPEELLTEAGERIRYHVTEKGMRIPDAYVITDGSGAGKAGYLRPGEKAYLGILDNAQNKENAAKLLQEMIRSDLE